MWPGVVLGDARHELAHAHHVQQQALDEAVEALARLVVQRGAEHDVGVLQLQVHLEERPVVAVRRLVRVGLGEEDVDAALHGLRQLLQHDAVDVLQVGQPLGRVLRLLRQALKAKREEGEGGKLAQNVVYKGADAH